MSTQQALPAARFGRDQQTVGDAVTLEVPLASLGHRFLGFSIDMVLGLGVLIGLLYLFLSKARDLDDAQRNAAIITAIALATFVLPVTVEALTGGRSLGKLAAGTRVVRIDQGPITTRHALVRGLLGLVEIWSSASTLAGLSVAFTRRSQRLGDLAAGTLVVRERLPLTLPSPVPMPQHLIGWASSADLATLPTELSMAIRQFLQRRMTLTPRARATLGQELLASTLTYVAPAPPPAHPDDILAAVLAERGRRDSERLDHERQRWHTLASRVR